MIFFEVTSNDNVDVIFSHVSMGENFIMRTKNKNQKVLGSNRTGKTVPFMTFKLYLCSMRGVFWISSRYEDGFNTGLRKTRTSKFFSVQAGTLVRLRSEKSEG